MPRAIFIDGKPIVEKQKFTSYLPKKVANALKMYILVHPEGAESVNQLMIILARIFLLDEQLQEAVTATALKDKPKSKTPSVLKSFKFKKEKK
jgi:hypothetical protein